MSELNKLQVFSLKIVIYGRLSSFRGKIVMILLDYGMCPL